MLDFWICISSHRKLRYGHVIGNTSASGEPSVSAVRSGSILPIGHSAGVDAVAFAPDGTLIASGNVDNLVRLWQMQTGKVWRTLTGHSSGVTSVAFSPDGKTVASGSEDNSVWLWDVQSGTVLRTLANVSRDTRRRVLAQQQERCGEM